MGIFLKLLYRYRPIKNQDFKKRNRQADLKSYMGIQKNENSQKKFCVKKKDGEIIHSDFKTYYKA